LISPDFIWFHMTGALMPQKTQNGDVFILLTFVFIVNEKHDTFS